MNRLKWIAMFALATVLIFAAWRWLRKDPYAGIPKRAIAYYQQGLDSLKQRRIEAAVGLFSQAINLDPTFADAQARMGEGYFLASLQHRSNRNENLRRNTLEQADQYTMNALGLDPSHGVAHYVKGLMAQDSNNLAAAQTEFESALSAGFRSFELHSMLGFLYNEKEMTAKSLEQYLSAYELNPEEPRTLSNLGELYFAVGNYDRSVHFFGELLKQAPEPPEFRARYAAAVWKSGDQAKAKELFNQIIGDGKDFQKINEVAWALIDRDLDPAWGVKVALIANELKPNNLQSLDILGWGYYKSGDYTKALDYLNKSQNQAPSPEVERRIQLVKEAQAKPR